MNFQHEYLFEWYHDESYKKAELLWLWYDYHTEIYDRGLWGTAPSPNDDTMVTFTSPEARKLSMKNASRVKNYITEIARYYELTDEVLNEAKSSSYRMAVKMQKRIDEFIELDRQGKFLFIYKINKDKK